SRNPPSPRYPDAVIAPTAASAVSAMPPAITQRSPTRSASAPHATSVRTRPSVGADASSPACARGTPRWVCSSGMRKAGADWKTVPAAWARTAVASMSHGRTDPVRGVEAGCAGRLGAMRPSPYRRAAHPENVRSPGSAAAGTIDRDSYSLRDTIVVYQSHWQAALDHGALVRLILD